MSFSRPDLATLIARAQAEIAAGLPGADPTLRRSLLGIVARVLAGGVHGVYGYLDWLSLQLMPDTATAEYLDRWGTIWGVTRKSPSSARGYVTMIGTAGSIVPAGTVLQRSDQAEYTVDAEVTFAGASADVAVTASASGADGNTAAGAKLSLTSAIAGVQSSATVAADGLTGGADTEEDADLLARLLARIQEPPQGGSAADYEAWALAVPGITRVWVTGGEMGTGTVTVRVMTDDTTADGIPGAEDVAAVQAAIDAERPVTADVYVVAPVAVPLDPIINISPNTAAVRAAVQAELADMLRREAVPGGTILVSHVREAVSIAAGEADSVVVSPAADVVHAAGEISTLGDITWGDLA